ncbi:MAG TPA: hypothetical protein GXX31_03880 [Methanothermobacter sp.]|nr:hypothetical protein [Methanothermobacter sp.]HOQ20298.1 hypothetical protein [Methanothermobacter sp.]
MAGLRIFPIFTSPLFTHGGFLRKVSLTLNGLDAVFITGNLIDSSKPVDSPILSGLNMDAPVFFVSEDPDTYASDLTPISDTDLICIDQSVVEFKGVEIVDVGDSMSSIFYPSSPNALDFDLEEPLVLLHYLPVDWEYARERSVDLQISGHTRGGQFYPFNLLVGLMFPCLSGLYGDPVGFFSISEGTGIWGAFSAYWIIM